MEVRTRQPLMLGQNQASVGVGPRLGGRRTREGVCSVVPVPQPTNQPTERLEGSLQELRGRASIRQAEGDALGWCTRLHDGAVWFAGTLQLRVDEKALEVGQVRLYRIETIDSNPSTAPKNDRGGHVQICGW